MLETPQNLIPLFARWCIAQHGLKVTHLFPQTKEQSHVLSSGSKQCGPHKMQLLQVHTALTLGWYKDTIVEPYKVYPYLWI